MIQLKSNKVRVYLFVGIIFISMMFYGCGEKATDINETDNTAGEQKETIVVEEETDSEELVDNSEVAEAETGVTAEDEAEDEKQPDGDNYASAYLSVVEQFQLDNMCNESEYCKLGYDLIYFNEDDIPELVTGLNGYYVNLYTYKDGSVEQIIDQWGYGAGGNHGYDYLERQSIIYNINSDMAGAEQYETYMKWDSITNEIKDMNDQYLMMRFYYDVNGDGNTDWSDIDEGGYTETPTYLYGDKEVTEEEYKSHRVEGEFKTIYGEMTYDEIVQKLQG